MTPRPPHRRFSVWCLFLSALFLSALAATPASAQAEPTQEPPVQTAPAQASPAQAPPPCDVAMVVGCVATINGPGGETSVVLRISETGAQSGIEGSEATEGGGEQAFGLPGSDEQGSEEGTNSGENPENEPPLRSGLDPWERGGLKANFGTNSIPVSHYQIGADVTGWLGVPDPLDSFVASQTNWAFTTSTFLVILATNALDWAFEFPLAEDLIGDAGILAQSYSLDYFGFGLSTSMYSLALTITMIVAGFKAITKGVIAAGSEVFLGFAAYVILIVLTLTSGFGDAGLGVARVSADLSGGIASFAAGQNRQDECSQAVATPGDEPPDQGQPGEQGIGVTAGTSSACTFGFAVQRSLVELPYQNLQWGQVLDDVAGKEQCAAINLELLQDGPWGNADEPRDRMRAVPECEENADFNHQATYIRLGIASANTIAAAAVTLLLLAVAAMLLWQQIKLLFLTVTMPHALVFAILPGRSRRMAWMWVEHLLGVVIRTAMLSLGLVVWLSLFSLIVHEQLTARGIFLSLFASMAMAISGFYGLYRLGGMTRRINPTVGRRAEPRITTVSDDGPGPNVSTRRVAPGTQATPRSVRGRSATTGGGLGDRPGGGAAAKLRPSELRAAVAAQLGAAAGAKVEEKVRGKVQQNERETVAP